MIRPIAALAIALLSRIAGAQSFNVDISLDGNPSVGGGVPSDSFGAAANQPGRWNYLDVVGIRESLFDLQGNVVPVSISTATSGGSLQGGGFANPSNTGDYAKLLNDEGTVSGAWRSWTFNGLANGSYRVVTYAVRPSPVFTTALVTISNSITPNPQVAQGIMPGNQLILGLTHTVHEANVVNSQLVITVSRPVGGEIVCVNGFQLTAVPEPISVIALTFALGGYILRKRNA
jgi:hypothetical protein